MKVKNIKFYYSRVLLTMLRIAALALISIPFVFLSCGQSDDVLQPGFSLLSPEATGIHFANTLSESEDFNIIEYLYYYNGGGVAIGDVNNDSLPDILFSGNQVGNKLYLNRGNLQFEDITDQAGIACLEAWNTGVNFVDVNADGWLDIYICQVGDYKNVIGRNQLFINQKDNTFKEEAAKYGLDFRGFSTHSAFFDYDRDGDLDLYLLNHSVHDPSNYRDSSARFVSDALAGDRLFRNDGERFTDVTSSSGIYSSRIGFGLGIAIADLNGDNCDDIYVSNDFHENDYLYYNNCDGTFTEAIKSSMMHTSQFSMGSDIADFNNDAMPDVMTLDMKPASEEVLKNSVGADPYDIFEFKHDFGYHYQYPRNMLQLNQGNLSGDQAVFSEIGQLTGVSATDWSWSTLFTDFNNDGLKDIFVSNGIVRRPNDLDYLKFISSPQVQQKAKDSEMAAQMPSGAVGNYFFSNIGNYHFEDEAQDWQLTRPSVSNGAAYADLDRDGDLDIVTNNINQKAFLYENNTTANNYLQLALKGQGDNPFSIGAKVWVYDKNRVQYQQLQPARGFMSGSDYLLCFGMSSAEKVDSIVIRWPSGNQATHKNIATNQRYTFSEPDHFVEAKPADAISLLRDITTETGLQFRHRENKYFDNSRENLIPYLLSTQGPAAAVADVNGDQLDDVFIGGAKGQKAAQFIQQEDGTFLEVPNTLWGRLAYAEDVDAAFFDADGDGDQDLYVVRGGNEYPRGSDELVDHLFFNDGRGNFTLSTQRFTIFENGSCVRPADYDGDGDVDLFLGTRSVPGTYGATPPSFLLENDGRGKFTDVTRTRLPALTNLGMVTDALWNDVDQNGSPDLVIVGEWMPFTIIKNNQGEFSAPERLEYSNGWYQSVSAFDLDQDGQSEFILGNFGLNNNLQPTPERPLELRLYDFDNNKSPEAILTYDRSGARYTLATKDELVQRMPSFRKRFPEYRDFARTPFTQVFEPTLIAEAQELKVQTLASAIVSRNTGGDFQWGALPIEAQFSTIRTTLIEDLDRDGQKDILLAGNFYEVQPSIGRQDASLGLMLSFDDAKKLFNAKIIGPNLSGPVRKLLSINGPDGIRRILVAENNGPAKVMEIK
jgi:hypothetical protein